jgi:peptide deformylase
MAIIPITLYGDKILRKKVKLVQDVDSQTVSEIKSMFETMRNANGIGLAANQVGLDKAIFVIDVSVVDGYEKIKPVVMINPKIVLASDEEVYMEEGCLSVPKLKAEVSRPGQVKMSYYDTDMKEQTLEADKLFSRVIQHEYDHLLGIFFTDKVEDEVKKMLKKDLNKIKNHKVDTDYPIAE